MRKGSRARSQFLCYRSAQDIVSMMKVKGQDTECICVGACVYRYTEDY